MIPFDFEYYRPGTIKEAVDIFTQLDSDGKNPVYYGGGTEIISMARVSNFSTGAVVDLKGIPECGALDDHKDNLLLGAGLTLSDITESKRFPLLEKTAGRIADHTMQCKITLGGNLASSIIYRETVLPLLLTNGKLTIANPKGLHDIEISQVFHHRLALSKGEFIVKAVVEKRWLSAPYIHVKKTKNEKVDYPLMTVACIKADGCIRIAFSGLRDYPFRDLKCEAILNDGSLDVPTRAERIADELRPGMLDNHDGSAAFRHYVLENTIENVLDTLKDV